MFACRILNFLKKCLKNPSSLKFRPALRTVAPGFDTLGIALSLYNFVRITLREDTKISPVDTVKEDTQAMVKQSAYAFFEKIEKAPIGFDYEIWGEVPLARGLGSSSTVRSGIVAGLNALTGNKLNRKAMIRLTACLENAPDNVCASFAGGFCIARTEPEGLTYQEHVCFELPESLVFIAVSPEYEVLTADSRMVLPDKIRFNDVVRSTNSLAYFVGIMVSGDFERLKDSVHDFIHQPYREKLNPFGRESIEAGCHTGAYTGWLSGSGSTVVCVTNAQDALAVGAAMQSTYENNGIKARVFRLKADNKGLTLS